MVQLTAMCGWQAVCVRAVALSALLLATYCWVAGMPLHTATADVGRELAGTIAARGLREVAETESNATSPSDEANIGEVLARAAGLKVRMPFYMLYISILIKPVLLIFVLGPPKLNAEEAWHKPFQIVVLIIIPFLAALKADVLLLKNMFGLTGLSLWQRFCGALMILGNSSNISSAVCLVASQFLAVWHGIWLSCHSEGAGAKTKQELIEAGQKLMLEKQGAFTRLVTGPIASVLMNLVVTPLMMAALPAVFAYFYISLAAFVVSVIVSYWWAPKLIKGLAEGSRYLAACCSKDERHTYEASSQIALGSEEARKAWKNFSTVADAAAALRPGGLAEGLTAMDNAEYDQDMEYAKAVGTPREPLYYYLMLSSMVLLFPTATVAAARLFVGSGYWPSLVDTWNDRSLETFVQYQVSAAVNAVGGAEETSHHLHPYLVLVQRWLVTLNHFL
mmetsp:Transcript_66038/g.123167  ORF Transcript_66038/g.123167 Transcript_66038/m.123167 type:complete len:449 (+) Transcript_66038:63-1409(+)